jgi:putative IMPACT (imprinted ancient) family translation regulator
MSHKRPRSASPPTPSLSDSKGSQGSHETYFSGAVKDRSSTFIALFSPTTPIKQLQAHPDFKTATHRIAAWRKLSAQRALTSDTPRLLFDIGHDDDGEQYGGKRLEKVLTEMNVQGALVVARWYGGVLLGPVRFTHMENCARDAIQKWKMGISATEEGEEHRVAQKRKVAEDQKRRPALVRILEERDDSISALRGLLREKMEELAAAKVDENTSSVGDANTTPIKAVSYSAMPLQALERLEKARDATISWILREIEKVEQQQEQ